MIFRIQSLYLAIALISSVLMFFFHFAEFNSAIASYEFSVLALKQITPSGSVVMLRPILLMSLLILIVLLIITSLAFFKNLIKQMRIVALCFFVNAIFLIVIFYLTDDLATKYNAAIDYKQFGVVLPIINILLLMLANKAIKNDEIKIRKSKKIR